MGLAFACSLERTLTGRLERVAHVPPFDGDFWHRPRPKGGALPGPFAEVPSQPAALAPFGQ